MVLGNITIETPSAYPDIFEKQSANHMKATSIFFFQELKHRDRIISEDIYAFERHALHVAKRLDFGDDTAVVINHRNAIAKLSEAPAATPRRLSRA